MTTYETTSRFLTDYIHGHKGDQEYMADVIAPIVNVGPEPKFDYRVYGPGMRRADVGETLSSALSPAPRIDILSTIASGKTVENKKAVFIPQRDLDSARARGQEDLHRTAMTDGLVNQLKLEREIKLATLLEDTANVPNTAATAVWGSAGATVKADIEGLIEAVRTASGVRANTLIIPAGNLRALVQDDEIAEFRMRNATIPVRELLTYMFESITRVIVPGAVRITSNIGQAEVTSDVWDRSKMWAAWLPETESNLFNRAPVKTFVRQGEGYNRDGRKVDVVETRNPPGEEIIAYEDYVHLITDTTIHMLTGCVA